MQLLRILYYPDKKLRETASPVALEDIAKAKPFIDELTRAMYAFDGVAIAAPQVGVLMRLIIVDLRPPTAAGHAMPQIPLVMFNPELIERLGGLEAGGEGCLSFPGVTVQVARFRRVKARFMGIDGVLVEQEFTGLQARAFQHEIEHLNGQLLIDHVSSPMRRDMIDRKMRKVAKHGGPRPKAPVQP